MIEFELKVGFVRKLLGGWALSSVANREVHYCAWWVYRQTCPESLVLLVHIHPSKRHRRRRHEERIADAGCHFWLRVRGIRGRRPMDIERHSSSLTRALEAKRLPIKSKRDACFAIERVCVFQILEYEGVAGCCRGGQSREGFEFCILIQNECIIRRKYVSSVPSLLNG